MFKKLLTLIASAAIALSAAPAIASPEIGDSDYWGDYDCADTVKITDISTVPMDGMGCTEESWLIIEEKAEQAKEYHLTHKLPYRVAYENAIKYGLMKRLPTVADSDECFAQIETLSNKHKIGGYGVSNHDVAKQLMQCLVVHELEITRAAMEIGKYDPRFGKKFEGELAYFLARSLQDGSEESIKSLLPSLKKLLPSSTFTKYGYSDPLI